MTVQLTEENIREFAKNWVAALDGHADFAEIRSYVVDKGLEMTFPEGVFREIDGLSKWYDNAINLFFDEQHTVIEAAPTISGDSATVRVKLNWKSRAWKPPAAKSTWLDLVIDQVWELVAGERGPLIKTYTVGQIVPMVGSGSL
jgi:SnoaL-like domain